MRLTKESFHEVIDEEPSLCADGLGVGDPARFPELRAELYERFDDFACAYDWLRKQSLTRRFNRTRTSLHLMHDLCPGICHGAFLAAAKYLAIPMRVCKSDPCSVYLPI